MTERQEEDQAKKTGSDVKSWQDPINQPSSRYVLLKLLTGQNELKKILIGLTKQNIPSSFSEAILKQKTTFIFRTFSHCT